MDRYGAWTARWYDLLSGEPVYGVGRRVALAALGVQPGERVLDVGCGTGLNLPTLLDQVGPEGLVVGLDLSPTMLDAARTKLPQPAFPQLRLVCGDAADPSVLAAAAHHRAPAADASAVTDAFDAVIATYSLSLMPDVGAAWRALVGVLGPAARVAVADMARPSGSWAWAAPVARVACWLGGADIDAHPWTLLERDLRATRGWHRRGGHVQVRMGVR